MLTAKSSLSIFYDLYSGLSNAFFNSFMWIKKSLSFGNSNKNVILKSESKKFISSNIKNMILEKEKEAIKNKFKTVNLSK